MTALDSLIRVNRWKIDEQRRQLGELERLAERLREEGVRLEQEMASEQRVAGASFEAGYAYAGFARELRRSWARISAPPRAPCTIAA